VSQRPDVRAASHLVIQAYEVERARLARDLHDGPIQSLAHAVFELQYCETLLERDPTALRDALKHLQDDLRTSLRELRRGILDLRPTALVELGLGPTLRHYCAEFERHFGLSIRLDLDGLDRRLAGDSELAVFRIVQEALQNVRKHARASWARLSVRYQDAELIIRVEDNGVGFTQTPHDGSRSFGLTSMRERAELLQGRLAIRPRRGGGTVVELRLPAPPQRAESGS
jgi:two-component system sensor histidine kinase DegS